MRVGHGWKERCPLFFQRRASGKETPKLVLVLAFHLSVRRTGTGDGCLFLLEPRASDLKPTKNETCFPFSVGSTASPVGAAAHCGSGCAFLQCSERASAAGHCSSRPARASLMVRRTSVLCCSLSCDGSECVPGTFFVLSLVFYVFNLFGSANLLR